MNNIALSIVQRRGFRFVLAGVLALAGTLAAAEAYRVPAAFLFQVVQATSEPTHTADGNVMWPQTPEETAQQMVEVARVVLRSDAQRPFPERITVVLAVKPADDVLHSTAITMTHEGEGSYSAAAAHAEEKAALVVWTVRHWMAFAKGHVVLERVDGAPDWSQAVAAEEDGTTIQLEVPGALPVPYPIQVPD